MSWLLPHRGVWGPILVVAGAWLVVGYLRTNPGQSAADAAASVGPSGSLLTPPGEAAGEPAAYVPGDDETRRLADYQQLSEQAQQVRLASAHGSPASVGAVRGAVVAAEQNPDQPQPPPVPTVITSQPASAPMSQPAAASDRQRRHQERMEQIRKMREAASRPATQPTLLAQPPGGVDQPPVLPKVGPEPVVGQQPAPASQPGGESRPPMSAAEIRARREQAGGVKPPPPPGQPRPVPQPGPQPEQGEQPDQPAQTTPPIDQPGVQPVTPAGAAPGGMEATATAPVPDDGRTEFFNFDDAEWEDVIKYFAERLGKPIIDELPVIGGRLTYKSPRKMTKEEAIDRLNLLMHLKQPGYRFVEHDDFVQVFPLNEMPQHLRPENTYATVDDFEKQNLRDMEYCQVFLDVKDRPAKEVVELFTDRIPEYARFTALEHPNQIRMTAVAKDIRNFLRLYEMLPFNPHDPRLMKVFPIKTNAAVIEGMARSLLNVQGAGGPQRRVNPQTGQVEFVPGSDSNIFIQADDRTNTLIVKGTPSELKKVEDFLAEFDKKQEIGEFGTRVVEVRYANARDVAQLLNDIFRQEQGQNVLQPGQRQPFRQPGRFQPGQPPQPPQPQQQVPGQPVPQDIFVEDIFERARKTVRIVPDERTNTLLVYANADGHKRVKDMLDIIDVAVPSNFRTFPLKHAKADMLQPIVEQIIRASQTAASGRAGGPARSANVIADPANNALHVIAEREAMTEVEEIIRQLDTAAEHEQRHTIELVNVKPSEMEPVVRQLLTGTGGGGAAARRSPRGGGPSTVVGQQIIAMDSANLLVVSCDDEDWKKVEETIRIWDSKALSNREEVRSFKIEKGNAAAIADTLSNIFREYRHPTLGPSRPVITPSGDTIWISAVKPALEEMGTLIAKLDVEPESLPLVILPLRYADASAVANQLQPLVTGQPAAPGRRFGPGGGGASPGQAASVTADAATNALIVRADADIYKQVVDFVKQIEEKYATATPERRFFTLQHAAPQDVATTLQTLFSGGAGGGGRGPRFGPGGGGGAPVGQVRAMQAGTQLLVEAPADRLAEVEAVIKQLDKPLSEGTDRMATLMRELSGLDVNEIANQLNTVFRTRPRADKLPFTFAAIPATSTMIATVPKDAIDEVDGLIKQFSAKAVDMNPVERFIDLKYANATEVAEQIRTLLRQRVSRTRGQDVADRLNVSVYTPLNRIVIVAPKFMQDMADSLIAEFDQDNSGQNLIQKIPLAAADAKTVADTLNSLLQPKLKANSALKIQAEAISNAIMVSGASKSDFEEIEKWARDIDEKAATELDLPPTTIALKHADPQQMQTMITQMFSPRGRAASPGREVSVTVSNGTLVVRAPAKQLEEIKKLVALVDQVDSNAVEVKTYALKQLSAPLIAGQVQMYLTSLGSVAKSGQLKPGAFAEPTTNTLVVVAPREQMSFIDLMVAKLDNAESGEIVRVVKLEQSDPVALAQTLTQAVSGGGRGGAGGRQVRVAGDAGSNTLVIAGLPADVTWAENLATEMDRASASAPEMRMFKLENTSSTTAYDTLKDVFPPSRNPADTVTITEDEYGNRLIVTASKRKMHTVEAYIKQLDAPLPRGSDGASPDGRKLYFVDIYKGDAWDIRRNVEKLLPDEKHGGPILDDDWDGKYIQVLCRPNEFENIEKLIRDYDERSKVTMRTATLTPKNIEGILPLIRGRMPNVQLQPVSPDEKKGQSIIIDLWGEDEAPPKVRPAAGPGKSDDAEKVAPARPRPPQSQPAKPRNGRRGARAGALVPVFVALYTPQINVPLALALQQPPAAAQPSTRPAAAPAAAAAKPAPAVEPVDVRMLPDGRWVITGPDKAVTELKRLIKDFDEDQAAGEVIRIFRFRYGDVNGAAQILEKMFTDQALRMPQMLQPQMQQQQQQQQGRGERGDEKGEGGRGGGAGGGGLMDQMRAMLGGGAGGRGAGGAGGGSAARPMRIATDPAHNYLIIKAEESLLPDIIKLLKELDIPPSDVDLRVFQLYNLDATETANNIKEVLGITAARRGGGAAAVGRGGGQPGNPQQQMIQILQEQLAVQMAGMESSARIESVQVVPNNITNSLLVSAPPEVMKIVEKVITDLEDLESRDITVIEHRKLESAKVDEVLPLLQEIFGGGGPRGGPGGGARPGGAVGGRGVSPAELGPVSIAGDPRSNVLIITAQAKDLSIVEEQIKLLDIPGATAEAEIYKVQYGDAESIATAVQTIFGGGGGARGGPGRDGGGAAGSAAREIRITAEPATNTIIVLAPEEKRRLIFGKIKELDQLNPKEIREINVVYGDPEKIAESLRQVFGGRAVTTGGGPGGPRRGGAGGGPAAGAGERIVVIGDKPARKVLVKAPDDIYQQMRALAQQLDVSNKNLAVKRVALQYADAQTVVQAVTDAVTQYVMAARATGNAVDFDAFVPVADPRTNSILVVGPPETTAMVDALVAQIDVPVEAERRKQLRVFVLNELDVQSAADAINAFASGAAPTGGGQRRGGPGGGGQPRGGPGAAVSMSAQQLDVQAVAEPAASAVLVFGRPEDIASIEEFVINPLLAAVTRTVETVPVAQAAASAIATSVLQFWGDAGNRGASVPQITPNDAGKSLVVYGTAAEHARVRALVKELDRADLEPQAVKIIKLPLGQDASRLAREVERIISQGENQMAQATGRPARLITVGADDYTNALIVYGNPTSYAMVQGIVDQLSSVRTDRMVTRIVNLKNLSADDAQRIIDDLQRRRSGTGTGSRGGIVPAGGGGFQPGGGGFAPGGGGGFQPGGGGGRQPGARPATPPARPQPQPPRGGGQRPPGGGGGNRGGSMLWPARPDERRPMPFVTPDPRAVASTATAVPPGSGEHGPLARATDSQNGGGPLVLAQPLVPLVAAGWLMLADPNDPPAGKPATKPATQPRPASTKPAAQPRPTDTKPAKPAETRPAAKDDPKRAAQPAANKQPAAPAAPPPTASAPAAPAEEESVVAGSDVIAGELRGTVVATPLDSRQLVIVGDESDVDFILAMLAHMETSAPQPEIEVFSLQNAKATALQQPVEQTVTRLIQQRTGQPGRGDAFSIIAEARSNSLIVAASRDNMELIATIIDRLDKGNIPSQFEAVPLLHMKATEAVNILKPMIESLNKQRQTPADATVTVQAVDRGNLILITGTPNDINDVRQMIASVDVELLPEDKHANFSQAELMVVNLENANSTDLAKTLNELIQTERTSGGGGAGAAGASGGGALIRQLKLITPDGRELPELDLDRPISIKEEKGTNSLLVSSHRRNNEALREIIRLFDSLPAGPDIDVKAITIQNGSAAAMAEMLQKLFDDSKKTLNRPTDGPPSTLQKGVMPPLPPNMAGRGLPYNVLVSHDARSNTIIVIGRKDAVVLAAGLVTQLDRPGNELEFRPYVISVRAMQASQLQEKLTDLLNKRIDALGGKDKNAARDGAVIAADDRSNSLVIVASPAMHKMITDMVQQLDSAEPYRVVDTRFRRLKSADAGKLQGILQEMFDKKKTAEGELSKSKEQAYVFADSRSNSLLLTGTRDYLNEAERLIDQLDQSFDPTVEFRVHPIVLNSAVSIATLLKDMIEKTRNTQDAKTKGTPIHVAADPYSNNLLIAAAREDLNMVERWVEVLDRRPEPGRVVRIVPIRRRKADDMATKAKELFEPRGAAAGAGGGGGGDITVYGDKATNSVVAVGPPAIVKDIEDTLNKLDEVDPTSGSIVKHFKLEQSDAEAAGSLLRSILAGNAGSIGGTSRGGGGGGTSTAAQDAVKEVLLIYQKQRPDFTTETLKAMRANVVVIDDVRTNSIYVTAPPESMPLMESLVAAIDIPPDAAKVRVFPLRNSTAEDMVKTLEALFQGTAGSGSTGAGGGRTGGGAGVTSGGTGDQQQRQLSLGEGPMEGGRQQLVFTTDPRTNAVIAAGTKGYLDLVEQLILQLDSEPIPGRKTIVYQPKNNPAEAIQTAIQTYSDKEKAVLTEMKDEISVQRRLEREILAVANKDTNRVVINYDPRRETDVLDLVRQLDQQPPQVLIQVLIIEVTLENNFELGVEFAYQDLQFTQNGTGSDIVVGADLGAAGAGLGGFTFTITNADFNFLLRALQRDTNLQVLSRPQIVAMDNQKASIDIANDVPYVNGTQTSTTGQIATSVARQKVGILLEVTPQINPDGFVRMQIHQEASQLTDSTIEVAPGVTSPIFFTRTADTVVNVRDNETVVLGGLIQSEDRTTESKIPILGDIPIVGVAFRATSTNKKRSELLLVLTPRVIRSVDDYRELSIHERDTTGLIPEDVLGSPLMNKLRVAPEDLRIRRATEKQPIVMPRPTTAPAPDRPLESDDYGPPLRGTLKDPNGVEATSYDIPLAGGPR